MAYIGNNLQVAFPSYTNIDDISGSFNGVTKSFPLTVSGSTPVPFPINSQQCLISVNGVIQRPDDSGTEGFKLSGPNIVFSSAPTAGWDFFGIILAGADYINVGVNYPAGSVSVPSITFTNDLDTGIYNYATNQLGITCGGTLSTFFTANGQSFKAGSAGSPGLFVENDTNTGIYSPGADQLAISTGGSGRLQISSDGVVTVGPSPSALARVVIPSSFNSFHLALTTASNGTLGALMDANGGFIGTFAGSTTDALRLGTGGTEKLRITSAGLVGVGTTSPDTLLNTEGGNVRVSGTRTAGSFLDIVPNNTGSNGVNFSVSYYGSGSYGPLNFLTGGSERVRIDSSGRVGIGSSSPDALLTLRNIAGGAPTYRGDIVLNQSGTIGGLDANGGIEFKIDGSYNGFGARLLQAFNGTSSYNFAIQTRSNSADWSTRLLIDPFGNVGIGTTTPVTGFEVANGNITVSGADRSLVNRSNNALSLGTNNTTRLHITSTGNVGIGTTTPGALLTVAGNLTLNGSNPVLYAGGNGVNQTATIKNDNGSNTTLKLASGNITFANDGDVERARIDTSGRLLVGTSSARTNVYSGSLATTQPVQFEIATNSRNNGLSIINNSNAGWEANLLIGASGGTSVGSNTAVSNAAGLGTIQFVGGTGTNLRPAASIKAVVDGGTVSDSSMPGRLEFSTTKDGQSSPTLRLNIDANGAHGIVCESNTDCLYVSTAGAAGTTRYLIRGRHSATVGTAYSGTESFRVYTNGNVENTNNSYAGISDIKLKENIVDASSQWDDIKRLQVRKYNFKEQTGQQTHTQIGLVAQEVELVSPGLVNKSPDRDAEGNDLGTVTKSVNYSVLYMKAVKALQEAMLRIEDLEARLDAANL